MTKYSPDQIERVLDLRESGKTYAQIQNITGVHRLTAAYHCRVAAVESPAKPYRPCVATASNRSRPFSENEDKLLLQMSLQGHSHAHMSRVLARQTSSVRHRLLRLASLEEESDR